MLISSSILSGVAIITIFNGLCSKRNKKKKSICLYVQENLQNGINNLVKAFTPGWMKEWEEELSIKEAINMEENNIVSELTSPNLNKQLISIYKYKQNFPNIITLLPEMETYCAAISMLKNAKLEKTKCLDALVRHSSKYRNSELAELPIIGADWDRLEISTRQWILPHGYYYCKNVYKDLLQEKINKMKVDLPKKPKNFTFIWKYTRNILYLNSPKDTVTLNISFPIHKATAKVLAYSLAPFVHHNLENPDL